MSISGAALAVSTPRGFEGLIHGATLADLVQMECVGMTNRAVRIDSGTRSGHIFFSGGQVVHAETGELRGEAALVELIGWQDGSFTIEKGMRPYSETISRPWQSLLISAAHLHDELRSSNPDIQPTMIHTAMPDLNENALHQVLEDPEIQGAAQFTDDGHFLDGKGNAEELHVTFSYVVQLARLIGESLGAEDLKEIHITAPEYRSLCVLRENDTIALMTGSKGNLTALAKRLS